MNWRVKSALQRGCAMLPVGQEAVYYFLQRRFGSLRRPRSPMRMLAAAADVVTELSASGFDITGARVLEVGTGRRIDLPLAFYLCGASSVITVDLHRYVKPDLVLAAVGQLLANPAEVREIFDGMVPPAQIDQRLSALSGVHTLDELLAAASIEYRAPADAADTGLPDGSIDLHVSYTVFEHIPRPVLGAILTEASRLLSDEGVAYHHIDPSDHFAHDDPTISAINFLRFPERVWRKYNQNQFAYHNRLRDSEYRELYRECHHQVLAWKPFVQPDCLDLLASGFPLAPEFQGRAPDDLCTTVIRVTSRPSRIHRRAVDVDAHSHLYGEKR